MSFELDFAACLSHRFRTGILPIIALIFYPAHTQQVSKCVVEFVGACTQKHTQHTRCTLSIRNSYTSVSLTTIANKHKTTYWKTPIAIYDINIIKRLEFNRRNAPFCLLVLVIITYKNHVNHVFRSSAIASLKAKLDKNVDGNVLLTLIVLKVHS